MKAGSAPRARVVRYAVLVQRALDRGELPASCDVDLALDLLISPLYWRLLVRRAALGQEATVRLVKALVAAVAATALDHGQCPERD